MVQTFDFGSIEEMDPSVGELFTTINSRSKVLCVLCVLCSFGNRGVTARLCFWKRTLIRIHIVCMLKKCGTPSA